MSFRSEGGYGKDNRILHTGEISEKSKVCSGASTRKGDRVPPEHNEVSLERVRLGREALTIGRYQRSTVGLPRSGAFARFRTLNGCSESLSGPPAAVRVNQRNFLIIADRLLGHIFSTEHMRVHFGRPEQSSSELVASK
jgi:hypothetical protein